MYGIHAFRVLLLIDLASFASVDSIRMSGQGICPEWDPGWHPSGPLLGMMASTMDLMTGTLHYTPYIRPRP